MFFIKDIRGLHFLAFGLILLDYIQNEHNYVSRNNLKGISNTTLLRRDKIFQKRIRNIVIKAIYKKAIRNYFLSKFERKRLSIDKSPKKKPKSPKSVPTKDKEHEVSYLLGHRFSYVNGIKRCEILTQWKGYPRSKDWSWEPLNHFNKNCRAFLSSYWDFVAKRNNPYFYPHLRKKLKEHLGPSMTSRGYSAPTCINPSNSLFLGGSYTRHVMDYFETLISNGYYSNEAGVIMKEWLIDGRTYDLNKPQIELLIWYEMAQLFQNQSRYIICKRPLGLSNNNPISQKCMEKELAKLTKDFYPNLSQYFFLSKITTIKRHLWKNYLNETQERSLICLLSVPVSGYGSKFHAFIAIISKLSNEEYSLRFIDSSKQTNTTKLTSLLDGVLSKKKTSRLASYGSQTDQSCLRQALLNMAQLIDGIPLSNFNWSPVS